MSTAGTQPPHEPEHEHASGYELLILVLCVYALFILAAQSFLHLDIDSVQILGWTDHALCVVFLIDFVYRFAIAQNRWKYFVTWGWIDLLSSIPAWGLQGGRALRVFRFLRVLRGVRATKVIANFILKRRAQNAAMAAVIFSILIVSVASIVILNVEDEPGCNIKGPGDALWWAFATVTTVGYGDRYPVTTAGRFVGAVLMTTGVGLFGAMSGFIAAWFLAPEEKQTEGEIEEVRRELAAIRALLEKRASGDASGPDRLA